MSEDRSHDFRGGFAIAVRVFLLHHAVVKARVAEESGCLANHGARVGPNDLCQSSLGRLRSLGHLTQHQHRLAQGGRFLLNSARVSQDEEAARHELNEGPVVERRNQVYAIDSTKQAIDRVPYLWI